MRAAAAGLLALLVASCSPAEPVSPGGPAGMRRLTEAQYRQTIADVFGPDIKVAGRFQPDSRKDGLLAVGTSAVTVTPSGFEQYDAMARTIAAQVVDEAHRDRLPCRPADAAGADRACAGQVLARHGRLLFRRPLTERELAVRLDVADRAAATLGDFHGGLAMALASLLNAPEFLFRKDVAAAGQPQRLDAWSKASRLSFLLWNAAPDETLLAAAERGDLDRPEGLAAEVDRLLGSPRLDDGVRAFFADFLGFDRLDTLSKDAIIYPKASQKVMADAKEQTLRTVTDHLLVRRADYRDLFTTRHTVMNRTLGVVYDVPVRARTGWEPHEFAADDARAGLLTQVSFTMTHAHPGRSSATLRGRAIRELLLCQKVPEPPANVNFAVVQDTANPQFRTARARLEAHSTDPTCAGCHKIIDPIGLALEMFDGLGQARATENEAPIDASGELDGARFRDAAGLGRVLRDHPATVSCLVGSVYRYAVGRAVPEGEQPWVDHLTRRFAADGHRLPDLLRRIAVSDAFYTLAAPAAGRVAAVQEDRS